MPNISVRDILRLALPPGTHTVAGASGLSRQVTRPAPLRATLPAFIGLRGGEVALVSVQAAYELDEQLTVAELIGRLSRVSVAAIVVMGELSDADREASEAAGMPLLQVPDKSDLREVEREILRLIGDYDAQIERRGAQLYNVLTQRSLAGMGVPGLLEALAERTGQSVACYSGNGELRAVRARGSARIALQSLRPSPTSLNLPLEKPIQLLNQQIWVEQIEAAARPNNPPGGASNIVGYVALAGSALDKWDTLAVQQSAIALALELAKEHAVQATEERLRGDFLSAVLAGPHSDSAALHQRGQDLGYNLSQPHVALLAYIENADSATLGRVMNTIQNELNRRNIAAPLLRRESAILCFLPSGEPSSDSAELGRNRAMLRPRELAEALRQRLISDYRDVILALGTLASTLAEWPRSLEESEQALMLGRQLFGQERVLAFSDLGVYRLLLRLRETPELWAFYRETLSKLVAYDLKQGSDAKQGGELLKTLEAYFNNLGNLAQTAKAIHVHRNTLLYRLERISQISGLNLNDPDEHFALWLALKAHRVLRTLEE